MPTEQPFRAVPGGPHRKRVWGDTFQPATFPRRTPPWTSLVGEDTPWSVARGTRAKRGMGVWLRARRAADVVSRLEAAASPRRLLRHPRGSRPGHHRTRGHRPYPTMTVLGYPRRSIPAPAPCRPSRAGIAALPSTRRSGCCRRRGSVMRCRATPGPSPGGSGCRPELITMTSGPWPPAPAPNEPRPVCARYSPVSMAAARSRARSSASNALSSSTSCTSFVLILPRSDRAAPLDKEPGAIARHAGIGGRGAVRPDHFEGPPGPGCAPGGSPTE